MQSHEPNDMRLLPRYAEGHCRASLPIVLWPGLALHALPRGGQGLGDSATRSGPMSPRHPPTTDTLFYGGAAVAVATALGLAWALRPRGASASSPLTAPPPRDTPLPRGSLTMPSPRPPPSPPAAPPAPPLLPGAAETGSQFVARIARLSENARETAIFDAVVAGKTPAAFRRLFAVPVAAGGHQGVVYVTGWHLAVGTDEDPLHAPVKVQTAQRIANALGMLLPTRFVVDATERAPGVTIISISPFSSARSSTATYAQSSAAIERKRAGRTGALRGYAKDYLTAPTIARHPGKFRLYGARWGSGARVQGDEWPHSYSYVDYSQIPSFMAPRMLVDGQEMATEEVLRHPELHRLVSSEGPITNPRYPV